MANTESSTAGKSGIVVVDIGKKQKRKAIRRLRRGEGRLMERVESVVQEIQENMGAEKNVQPIVLIVERKKKRNWGW